MARKPRLRAISPEPRDASVIDTLEDVLAEARKGEISSVSLAIVYRNGETGTAWSALPRQSVMLGAVGRLQFAIARQLEED